MAPDLLVPSVEDCCLAEAGEVFTSAGWEVLADNPGQNSKIFYSPCNRYVARLAHGDEGFEEFAAMCAQQPSRHLPVMHVDYRSSEGVHLVVMDRLKRYRHDSNREVEKQVALIQDLIWERDGGGSTLESPLKKTILAMFDAAMRLHRRTPQIYEGLDITDPDSENFLFRENADGTVQVVFTDVFARRGRPVSPDWKALRDRLSKDLSSSCDPKAASKRQSAPHPA